jgi:hypothetical protein
MVKSRRRKRDHIWFYGRWPRGYLPITVEGLVLNYVAAPIGILLMVSPAWLGKLGFDPGLEAPCFGVGVFVMLVCALLYVTHRGTDRNP